MSDVIKRIEEALDSIDLPESDRCMLKKIAQDIELVKDQIESVPRCMNEVHHLFIHECRFFNDHFYQRLAILIKKIQTIRIEHFTPVSDMMACALSYLLLDKNIKYMEPFRSVIRDDLWGFLERLSHIEVLSAYQKDPHHVMKVIMTIAMKDMRVIWLAWIDRAVMLDYLYRFFPTSTLHHPQIKQYAEEAIDIMAPLADCFGVHALKLELEKCGFMVLHPSVYASIESKKKQYPIDRIKRAIQKLERVLKAHGVENYQLRYRVKSTYSIYKKMVKKNVEFESIHDLCAIRVIVDQVETCYQVLGLAHKLWASDYKEYDDYIMKPKKNGYQSIHALMKDHTLVFELQIRTDAMNTQCEYGKISHWKYKHQRIWSDAEDPMRQKMQWFKQMIHWQDRMGKNDDYIYCMTPKGDIITLKKGSTVLDMAYAIHTEIGHHCKGGRIDQRFFPIHHPVQQGDIVQIVCHPEVRPHVHWLLDAQYAKTSRARQKIRSYLYSVNELTPKAGAALRQKSQESKQDKIQASHPVDLISKKVKTIQQSAHQHIQGMLMHIAQCCCPIPYVPIVGYISKTRGMVVHHAHCSFIRNVDPYRIHYVQWSQIHATYYSTPILMHHQHVEKITQYFKARDIPFCVQKDPNINAQVTGKIWIKHQEELRDILRNLSHLSVCEAHVNRRDYSSNKS